MFCPSPDGVAIAWPHSSLQSSGHLNCITGDIPKEQVFLLSLLLHFTDTEAPDKLDHSRQELKTGHCTQKDSYGPQVHSLNVEFAVFHPMLPLKKEGQESGNQVCHTVKSGWIPPLLIPVTGSLEACKKPDRTPWMLQNLSYQAKEGKSKVSVLVTFDQSTERKTLKKDRLFVSQVHWAQPRIAWPGVLGKDITLAGECMAEQTTQFLAGRKQVEKKETGRRQGKISPQGNIPLTKPYLRHFPILLSSYEPIKGFTGSESSRPNDFPKANELATQSPIHKPVGQLKMFNL